MAGARAGQRKKYKPFAGVPAPSQSAAFCFDSFSEAALA
jgi:hypothetical protein